MNNEEEWNRYKFSPEFKEAAKMCAHKMPERGDNVDVLRQERKDFDAIRGAMRTIADAVNGNSPAIVGKVLAVELAGQHRTLQASVIRALLVMFGIYKGAAYDLRNKAAVDAAEKVADLAKKDIAIPFI